MLAKNRAAKRGWGSGCLLVLATALLSPATTYADAKAGERKAQLCVLCHRPNHPDSIAPTLEGQTREYLVAQLKAYKAKRRSNTVMQTNTMSLSERDMGDIADYFSSQKPVRANHALDPARVARGKAVAEELQCAQCHGVEFAGRKEVPRLAGMEPRYTAWQLAAYATGSAQHPPTVGITSLAREDIINVAQYLAGLQ